MIKKEKLLNILLSIDYVNLNEVRNLNDIYKFGNENKPLYYYINNLFNYLLDEKYGTHIGLIELIEIFNINYSVADIIFKKINNDSENISFEEFLDFFLKIDEKYINLIFEPDPESDYDSESDEESNLESDLDSELEPIPESDSKQESELESYPELEPESKPEPEPEQELEPEPNKKVKKNFILEFFKNIIYWIKN